MSNHNNYKYLHLLLIFELNMNGKEVATRYKQAKVKINIPLAAIMPLLTT